MKYTVQFAKKMGDGQPDRYGNVGWSVKFVEEAESVIWNTQKAVEEGLEVEGEVEHLTSKAGKPYRKFRAGSNQDIPSTGQQWQNRKSESKDRQDGMRQGMVINNAAQFVLRDAPKNLPPEEWAEMVMKYAKELYTRSNLTDKDVESAKELFSGN